MPSGNVDSLSIEKWDTSLDLNLRAPFLLAQEVSKKMEAGGLIVNITDVGAQKTWSRYPSYTVSKAALRIADKDSCARTRSQDTCQRDCPGLRPAIGHCPC